MGYFLQSEAQTPESLSVRDTDRQISVYGLFEALFEILSIYFSPFLSRHDGKENQVPGILEKMDVINMMLNVESFQVIVSKIVERSLTKELKRELYIECWCRPPPAPAQTESQHINVFNRVEIGRSFRRRVAMAEDCCKRIKIEAFVPPQPSPPGHVSTFKYQTHCSEALLLSSLGTVVIRPTMEFQKQRTGHQHSIYMSSSCMFAVTQ